MSYYAIRINYAASSLAALPSLLESILACDPNAFWSHDRSTSLPANSFRDLIQDAVTVRRVCGSMRWRSRVEFEIQTIPQLTLTVANLGELTYSEAREFMIVCASWLPCDLATLHRLDDVVGAPGTIDYLARAAVNQSGDRYESIGPLVPGAFTIASPRVRDLAGMWSPTEGPERPTQDDYRRFCDSGLAAPMEWKGKRATLAPGPSWRALPSLRLRPCSQPELLKAIADTSADENLVDLEELIVPDGADFTGAELSRVKSWYLGLRGCSLRWACLDDSMLVECGFEAVDLTGALLTRAEITALSTVDCSFRGVDFTGARILDGRFQTSSFAFANFSSAQIQGSEFVGCDFANAHFDGSTHQGCSYVDCKLGPEATATIQNSGGHVR